MKVIILVPFFGSLPPWFEYFLQSCSYNSTFTWHIFTNDERSWNSPPNIVITHFSLADFNNLASDKLKLNIKIANPYKICDFKPAFGLIFNDYIKEYDFWGYSDLDLIYGNIDHFIHDDLLRNHEIVSVREEHIAGHFALLRYNNRIITLFYRSPCYLRIFSNFKKHYAFDEKSNIFGRRLFKNSKYRLAKECFLLFEKISNKIRFKFLFRWDSQISDLNQIVTQTEMDHEIRVFRKTMVRSDKWFMKKKVPHWEIKWENGRLFDVSTDHELLHFHMIASKYNKKFKIQQWQPNNAFKITNDGIFLE